MSDVKPEIAAQAAKPAENSVQATRSAAPGKPAATGETPIIFLDDISVTFKTRTGSLFHPNRVQAVQNLTLTLNPGETLGIVGESGCGKSTTANVMCGLQSPSLDRKSVV